MISELFVKSEQFTFITRLSPKGSPSGLAPVSYTANNFKGTLSMKHIIICNSIIFVLLSLNLFGQDSIKTSLVKDKFALQFQLDGLYFSDFQGNTLSCKYQISDISALRFGLGVSGSKYIKYRYNNVDRQQRENVNINVRIQYIRYIKTVDDISLYLGTGPFYSRNFTIYNSSSYDGNDWTLGVNGIIGVEWFFKKNMSLSGEYGIAVGYNSSKYFNSNDFLQETQMMFVNSNGLLQIGLSLYL